jgi:hypothetical protein
MITNLTNQKMPAISRYVGWELARAILLGSLSFDFPPLSPYLAEARQMNENGLR